MENEPEISVTRLEAEILMADIIAEQWFRHLLGIGAETSDDDANDSEAGDGADGEPMDVPDCNYPLPLGFFEEF
jgi:hypothetical protein